MKKTKRKLAYSINGIVETNISEAKLYERIRAILGSITNTAFRGSITDIEIDEYELAASEEPEVVSGSSER